MSDPVASSQTQPGMFDPGKSNLQLIYVLYLASLVVGVTAIVGVIFAYISRGKADGWVVSHYTYQIRTFWIGLLYSLISAVLAVVGIGFLLFIAVAIWGVVRCVKGLQATGKSEPIENPQTWLV
ncbi:DUF4870 family protein [Amorphus orientalis]|uniref:Membrane protein n=1 Tax=Amorphus orientalis TaxID=649198 RepID=A0AAE3VSW8_9HYPH|nr:hypothetical protein [Amorphus orientalis]MDQ0317558.1 putative membrane protein [Amorphus orientalis]